MKLAIVQYAPAFLDVAESMRRLGPLLDEAAGADLVVVPELVNSGYNFGSAEEAGRCAEPVEDSRYLDFLAERCRAYEFEVVSGFCERASEGLYNSAVLVGAGGVVGRYRKLHLFVDEKDYFLPGDEGLPVFDRPYGRVGMLICFDWAFFEAWRVLALKGADVICHPANLVLPGKCQQALPVYAMTNRVYVALANRVGAEGELTFTGSSLIADPAGAVVAEAPATGPAVRLAEVDVGLARDKQITRRNDLFGDRRPGEYGALADG